MGETDNTAFRNQRTVKRLDISSVGAFFVVMFSNH